jgi:hypothetical protein
VRHQTNTDQRFVDLHELACGGCRDDVADGPDGFTHNEGTALCASATEPVEVTR